MTHIPDRMSILQISDSHILPNPGETLLGIDTDYYFRAVLEQAFASEHRFDLILFTGDLAQHPGRSNYQHILKTLEAYETPCVCLPGNHDDYDLMQEILNTELVNCRKQVFLGNWQIISLNSQVPGAPEGYLSNQELTFLEQCLDTYPDHYALIAMHHHCLSVNSPWMDTMMIGNAQELFAIINKHPNVKAVTFGHIHQAIELDAGSVQAWGSPSTCFQFQPGSTQLVVVDTPPGYRLIQLSADGQLESEVHHLPEPLTGLKTDVQGY
jgi:Icc protein